MSVDRYVFFVLLFIYEIDKCLRPELLQKKVGAARFNPLNSWIFTKDRINQSPALNRSILNYYRFIFNIVTARKRSLGKGNVLHLSVSHLVRREGVHGARRRGYMQQGRLPMRTVCILLKK